MTNQARALPIGDTIKSAWHKIYGAKASIWGALIVAQIILIVLLFVSNILTRVFAPLGLLSMIATACIFAILQIGIYYIGIQRAANAAVSYKQMYYAFTHELALKTIGLLVLQMIIMLAPAILMMIVTYISIQMPPTQMVKIVSGIIYFISFLLAIYLVLSMLLGMGNVLVKKMGPVAAITHSFEATRSHLIEMFLIYVVFAIIYILLSIPFGIGLIWGIPFAFVLYGEIYQRLAG